MRWRFVACALLLAIMLPATPVVAGSDATEVSGTVPLETSGVSASNIGYHSATISWQTNGNATSQVFYDTVSHDSIGDYAHHSDEDSTLVSEHSIRLTGLSSSTTYHYRVKSEIPGTEFVAISGDYRFKSLSSEGGGGGGAPSAHYTETNLFGSEASFRISSTGEILETIEASSEGGMLTVTIPTGTIALGEDGKRLRSLEIAADDNPPPPPQDAHIIGLAYDFKPSGATFDPPFSLTWRYDEADIPEGVAEKDLALAYYDEDADAWVSLACVVDTTNNVITATVPHFTIFAIIGPITALPAPAAFIPSSLSISPAEVYIGDTVTISISVANTGGQSGVYKVELKINGVVEESQEIELATGASKKVTFTTEKDVAGTYSVDVNGLAGSFKVQEQAAPPSWLSKYWWTIVVGIVAIGLIVFFIVRRRKASGR